LGAHTQATKLKSESKAKQSFNLADRARARARATPNVTLLAGYKANIAVSLFLETQNFEGKRARSLPFCEFFMLQEKRDRVGDNIERMY